MVQYGQLICWVAIVEALEKHLEIQIKAELFPVVYDEKRLFLTQNHVSEVL